MPHIHTEPSQHDMTVSAYIVLHEGNSWKCLVHFHRKIERLMQIGGHIELNETPWQTMVHELQEESGYKASELMVLQPTSDRITESATVYHPVPFIANTHGVGNEHYHSDWCYGFVASERPQRSPALSESTDLRWLTIEELKAATVSKTAVADVLPIYQFLLDHLESYVQVPASGYSVKKPTGAVATYKRGAPGANN